jgi:hypothetical protein
MLMSFTTTPKLPRSSWQFAIAPFAVLLAFNFLAVAEAISAESKRELEVSKLTPAEKKAFADMSPTPVRVYATFGIEAEGVPGSLFYNAHPDSKLWFKVESGRRHIAARFRIVEAAWKDVPKPDSTDGVLFRISEVRADASTRVVFERLLKPRDQAADRGVQDVNVDVDLAAGSELLFETTPGPAKQYARDWASWGKIEIR